MPPGSSLYPHDTHPHTCAQPAQSRLTICERSARGCTPAPSLSAARYATCSACEAFLGIRPPESSFWGLLLLPEASRGFLAALREASGRLPSCAPAGKASCGFLDARGAASDSLLLLPEELKMLVLVSERPVACRRLLPGGSWRLPPWEEGGRELPPLLLGDLRKDLQCIMTP